MNERSPASSRPRDSTTTNSTANMKTIEIAAANGQSFAPVACCT